MAPQQPIQQPVQQAQAPAPAPQQPAPQAAAPAQPNATGQWVYTSQYGWLWMPFAQSYTYVPASGNPQMYVYYPAFGWRWVVAPWVFGWGPRPYWGVWGPRYYHWYARPWFRVPVAHHVYRPHYRRYR